MKTVMVAICSRQNMNHLAECIFRCLLTSKLGKWPHSGKCFSFFWLTSTTRICFLFSGLSPFLLSLPGLCLSPQSSSQFQPIPILLHCNPFLFYSPPPPNSHFKGWFERQQSQQRCLVLAAMYGKKRMSAPPLARGCDQPFLNSPRCLQLCERQNWFRSAASCVLAQSIMQSCETEAK